LIFFIFAKKSRILSKKQGKICANPLAN